MQEDIIKLLELYILYNNAYDDDLEEKETYFLEQYIVLENLIRGDYEESRPYLFGLKE